MLFPLPGLLLGPAGELQSLGGIPLRGGGVRCDRRVDHRRENDTCRVIEVRTSALIRSDRAARVPSASLPTRSRSASRKPSAPPRPRISTALAPAGRSFRYLRQIKGARSGA